jgi:hypothetical protein
MSSDKLRQSAQYFSRLFDPSEPVWVTNTLGFSSAVNQPQALLSHVGCDSEKGSYISINPAREHGIPRGSANVGALRNFLIEFDDMPITSQRAFFESKGIPYTASVFSGGKSHHFIISLSQPLKSTEDYKSLFRRLYVLYDEKNDPATKDPARWSRFPNAYRSGVIQRVNDIKDRIPLEQIMEVLNRPENLEKWKQSKFHKMEQEFLRVGRAVSSEGDRDKFISMMAWYIKDYLKDGIGSDKGFYQCPVCASEGKDNSGDNLYVTPSNDWRVHCFAGDEIHNRKIYETIKFLRESQEEPCHIEPENWIKLK